MRGWLAFVLVAVVLGASYLSVKLSRHYRANLRFSPMAGRRRILLSLKEALGLVRFSSEFGQDKWVSEVVFPGVTDGFFLDVGSGDGVDRSNTVALERKGWTGICVDPFPTNMQSRRCQVFKEVVYSEAGKPVTFYAAGPLGGIGDSLGVWKEDARRSPAVALTTVTLGDILDRAKAPAFIHFMSLDIEGAELEALRGVPFDRYRFGALAIEHNYEDAKRREIRRLLERHGYTRVRMWQQDDFYVPAASKRAMGGARREPQDGHTATS